MAEEKVIEINVNATQADKTLKKFGGTLEDVYGEGVQPLNFAIGELEDRLYEMAAAGQSGTVEFAEMAKEVGRMKKVIIDTDLAVDGMAEGIGVNLGGAIQGVSGGFTLAQGAMGAFGVNSEALEETLLKVQSAMAITDGIQSVREGIKSFKALKVAAMSNVAVQKLLNLVMSMNPIGIIITAVAALSAAIYALWDPIKKLLQFFGLMEADTISAADANEQLTKSYERQSKAIERLQKVSAKAHDNRMRELKLRDASEKEIHEATLERLKEEEQERTNQVNFLGKTISKRKRLYKKALAEEDWETAKSIREQNEKDRAKYQELIRNNKEYNLAKREEEKRYQGFLDDQREEEKQKEEQDYKDRLDRWKDFQENRKSALRLIEDLQLEINDDEIKANNVKYQRLIEDTKANENLKQSEKEKIIELYELQRQKEEEKILKNREELVKESEKRIADFKKQAQEQQAADEEDFYEQYNQNTLTQRQLEEQAITDKYFFLIEKAREYGLDVAELERRQAAELEAIEEESSRKKQALKKEELNAKLQMTSDAFMAINDLVQAFASEDEASARRAFNINKGVGIAQAVISTAQGIINAYANPVDVASGVAFAKSGIIAATGAAQIATIARTKFQGSGGGSATPASGSVPNASAASPQFNVVGDTGVNQLAQTLGQQGQQPVQAYVVAGNVTSAQSLERNKIQNASL